MSFLGKLLGRKDPAVTSAEVATSRETNTEHRDPDAPLGTTSTGGSDKWVGRVAGQDEGYAGTTGAEVREAVDDEETPGSAGS